MATAKDVNSYKYCYIVNLTKGEGQVFPTYTPVVRDPVSGKFPRISGEAVSTMALYYVDEVVDEDSPASVAKHTTVVLRGGPNVIRPDSDDEAILRRINESGTFTEGEYRAAVDNATVMATQLAADGHFKFSFS
jgi:hypothetical protein